MSIRILFRFMPTKITAPRHPIPSRFPTLLNPAPYPPDPDGPSYCSLAFFRYGGFRIAPRLQFRRNAHAYWPFSDFPNVCLKGSIWHASSFFRQASCRSFPQFYGDEFWSFPPLLLIDFILTSSRRTPVFRESFLFPLTRSLSSVWHPISIELDFTSEDLSFPLCS